MRRLVVFFTLSGLLVPLPALAQGAAPNASAGTAANTSAEQSKPNVYQDLNLFGEAFDRIKRDAVDPVGSMKLVKTAITGMLSGLDSHSVYIDEATYQAEQKSSASYADTTGLVVTVDHGLARVVSPRDGSPAAAAGIKPGDLIFFINREPTDEMSLPQIEAALRGPAGSSVKLTIKRAGVDKPIKVTLNRMLYTLKTVTYRVYGGNIGYIRIAGFDPETPAALDTAVQHLRDQLGNKLIGLILDLRNNPAGSFDPAVKVADAFLSKGVITQVKSRDPDKRKTISATPGDIAKGLPIVALIDGGTAEEAELVAAALQDNHRAVLLGTKTFGESAIESVIPLGGDDGAIRLTTARFLTPDGNAIEGKGITPNITVEPLKLQKFAESEQIREVDLPGALKNPDLAHKTPTGTAAPGKPGNGSAQIPAGATAVQAPSKALSVATRDIGSSRDEELLQAADVLRGLAVLDGHNID